jgi:hypothetical protein
MTAMTKPQAPRRRAPKRGTVADLSTEKNVARPPDDDAGEALRTLKAGFDRDGEQEQRAAIARLLRSNAPLEREFRDVLALLFERWANGRRLVFERKRGRQIDPARTEWIAWHVQMLQNLDPTQSKESAVAETANFFDLRSHSQVYAALKKHKPKSPV